MTFIELRKKQIKKYSEQNVEFECHRFNCINNELWCVAWHTNKIHVLYLDGAEKRVITCHQIDQCRSVAAFKNKILIAATNGLFVTSASDVDVVHAEKLLEGDLPDVSVFEDSVYTFESSTLTLHSLVLDKDTNQINVRRKFNIKELSSEHLFLTTIQATADHVYIARFLEHIIEQYTLDGKLIETHGKKGSNIDELIYPLLTGSDTNGDLLVVDQYNHRRLKILRHDGSWQELRVEVRDRHPSCVRIHDGRLYVTLGTTLQIFSIY